MNYYLILQRQCIRHKKTAIKRFFQYRLLPIYCQIYKLLGITNKLKKDFILVERGGIEPPSEKPTSSVLHAQSIFYLTNWTPTDRLRHGELNTISRFSLKRASLAILFGVTIDPLNNRRIFEAMASLSGQCERFVVCNYSFAAFYQANRPWACTLGFMNLVESQIRPKALLFFYKLYQPMWCIVQRLV